jgi:hypothetical protein
VRSHAALAQRTQDEYEYAMSRAVDSWGSSPPSRMPSGDFSENRRRQPRGRNGNNGRPGHHFFGRPTSVGSARFISPGTNNHPNSSQRAPVLGMSSTTNTANNNQRRSITPGLNRANSSSGVPSNPAAQTTPPRNRISSGLSSSPEQPSPPVAFGSGDVTRDRRAQDLLDMQRQIDVFSESVGDGWSNPFAVSRRSLSPGSASSTSSRNIQRNTTASYQPAFGDLNDPDTRYNTRDELFQRNILDNPQPRWSQ